MYFADKKVNRNIHETTHFKNVMELLNNDNGLIDLSKITFELLMKLTSYETFSSSNY